MVFQDYAKYYNLLYSDKNYLGESNYILETINKFSSNVNKILDVGCGTGKHDSLIAAKGFSVSGIDVSSEMIDIAKSANYNNCEFFTANAFDFNLSKTFDVTISLFHVISYQNNNKELHNVFSNIRKHLKKDGLFIFDFWYGPAVLNIKPTIKVKRLENEEIKVTRISEPKHHVNENIVDVNFELQISNKKEKTFNIINEVHRMRYFTIPELNYFLENSGFMVLNYEEWMTSKMPSENTWGVCCIAKAC